MIKTLKEIAFDLRVKMGYTAAFGLLLLSCVLTLYGSNEFRKQTGWVQHTSRVIKNLEGLVSGMKDAETGLRGYINTRDPGFLKPYKNSIAVVDTLFSSLKTDTKDNTDIQEKLGYLDSLIAGRYTLLAFAIDYYPRANYVVDDTLLQSFYKGRTIMDSIRSVVNHMQQQEEYLLNTRTTDLQSRYKALNIIIITSFILALLFAVFGFLTYRREYKARLVADEKADSYQKELQQRIVELDRANKELVLMKRNEKFAATGRIARTIAHEIRNPLTNIDLAVSQIKADMPVQDENSNMLFDMLSRNSKRINQLISELLNATRFAELSYNTASINTLLDEALDLAKDRIDLSHIRIEKKYSTDICDISVDPEKIKIAFLNLIVNAIEAMEPEKGVLQIQTKGEDNKCVVEIADNGCGMTEDELNKLFEPYFTTKEDGNGLGLTNTHNIILNHKGSISVSSTPGEGTVFVIKFDFVNPA